MEERFPYRNSPCAELKSTDGKSRLRLYTYAYEYPHAEDGVDADWYKNYIELICHGFSVHIDVPALEGRVVERWCRDIPSFIERGNKPQPFYPMGPILVLLWSMANEARGRSM
ncbi:hypothetical protein MO973_02480 [Paenibacillus sp. TRM 82003]|nr:hypothetical protein [Paenibacillus sp. TRM 82003]